jgi:hypothetical protein
MLTLDVDTAFDVERVLGRRSLGALVPRRPDCAIARSPFAVIESLFSRLAFGFGSALAAAAFSGKFPRLSASALEHREAWPGARPRCGSCRFRA